MNISDKKIIQINEPGNKILYTKYISIIWKENLNKKYKIFSKVFNSVPK